MAVIRAREQRVVVDVQNFYQLDDAFQATYILESIIENFNQFPEIVKEAKKDIENIKMVEAKNNASISIENLPMNKVTLLAAVLIFPFFIWHKKKEDIDPRSYGDQILYPQSTRCI